MARPGTPAPSGKALFSPAELVSFGKEAASAAAIACAKSGAWGKVEALLAAGCPLETTRGGESLGSALWAWADLKTFRRLEKARPEIWVESGSAKSTPLFLAAFRGDEALFAAALASHEALLRPAASKRVWAARLDAASDTEDGSRMSALSVAALKGSLPILSGLLASGANPDGSPEEPISPLLWAMLSPSDSWRPIAEALLAAGADPHLHSSLEAFRSDAWNRTSSRGVPESVRQVPFFARENTHLGFPRGDLLSMAAQSGSAERLRFCLAAQGPARPFDGYQEDVSGTALQVATAKNRADLLAILLEGREDSWHEPFMNNTHWAEREAEDGSEFYQFRLSNPREHFATILLQDAVETGSPDAADFWLRRGARPERLASFGSSSASYGSTLNDDELAFLSSTVERFGLDQSSGASESKGKPSRSL